MLGETLKDSRYGHISALHWFSKNTEASANVSSVLAVEPHCHIDFHLVWFYWKLGMSTFILAYPLTQLEAIK